MGSQLPWQGFDGPNLGYVHQLYEQYLNDPASIDPEVRVWFEQWGTPPGYGGAEVSPAAAAQPVANALAVMQKAIAATQLVQQIRMNGHLIAKINPFVEEADLDSSLFDLAKYGLTAEDLRSIPAKVIWPEAPAGVQTAYDVVQHLRQIYTGTTAYQFMHIPNLEERDWLNRTVELGTTRRPVGQEDRVALLKGLTEAEEFEQFLHHTFAGQKRFSLEGLETLIPMMDELVREGVRDGVRHVLIGMAHRGRLNVLAHILGKPYENIFAEFHHAPNKELVPSEGSMGINYGWTGDVKYHMGRDWERDHGVERRVRITMGHNPSHLEFIDAVTEGYTRAAQEDRLIAGKPQLDTDRAFAILIHGDSAFPGEGVVSETINMSKLPGFQTGGTIHIISNNQIGFTTESIDSRSTRYSSGPARGYEIPIIHVNADDPEACVQAIYLAYAYRKRYKKDFLIDLIGFRRHGHNETDDPVVTNPLLYVKVNSHPGTPTVYANALKQQGLVADQILAEVKQSVQERLKAAYEKMKSEGTHDEMPPQVVPRDDEFDVKTSVPAATLGDVNSQLLTWPAGFNVYPKLEKILKRREDAFNTGIDWALAESLAFGTILLDGTPIRMSGQDSERGTFAHRNLVLHDYKTGESYTPLQHLPGARASFAVYNSPLTETAVMGFEYGYDVLAKDTLVLWEAQFGDFANVAQVIVDQFISAGRAKWGQPSSLVLLLPHGYEGMGPEHSSARLERYLQLSAEHNWTVANLSRSSQLFHLLRWQASRVGRDDARPLVLMTPKSLLRNPRASVPVAELSDGFFRQVLEQPGLEANAATAERLVLCSGKVSVDLEAEWDSLQQKDNRVHIARVEQLYPFPEKALQELLARCPQLKEIVWMQEEPHNMGAWSYMEPRLRALTAVPVRYVGRPDRSSPAEGMPDAHKAEQARILHDALTLG